MAKSNKTAKIKACEKIYVRDRYARSCIAKVTSFGIPEDGSGDLLITLDRTVFFPTGGGQSCDIGSIKLPTRESDSIIDVQEKGDLIIHRIAGAADKAELYCPGAEVFLDIDWYRRFDNMQRHLGEHILSGAFYHLYKGANKGFHMGDKYMTVDISEKIDWEMAKKAEAYANEVIWKNAPVHVDFFETKLMAENLPTRKPIAFEKNITIVTVGDYKNPYDCIACCGTHPNTSGEVGLIKIYKVESNKGMTRVFFEAGKRAFENYQSQFDNLSFIENSLSAGDDDIKEKFVSLGEKNDKVRDELYTLKKKLFETEAEALSEELTESQGDTETDSNCQNACLGVIAIKRFVDYSLSDIAQIAKFVDIPKGKLVLLISEKENGIMLFSDKQNSHKENFDCGKLVKKYGTKGKGGGKATNARLIFDEKAKLEAFVQSLCSAIAKSNNL